MKGKSMITKEQSKLLIFLVENKIRSGVTWMIDDEDENAEKVFLQSSEALNLYIESLTEPDSEPAEKSGKGT